MADWALGLAIHDFHGMKIEVKDYTVKDGTYRGTLEYTFYDHFGLDDDDWFKSVGFPAWFALQHDQTYGNKGAKPVVAVVKLRRQISGTIG